MKKFNKNHFKNIYYPFCSVHDITSVNYIDKHILDMKTYWYGYVPVIPTAISSEPDFRDVFVQDRNIVGRSVRCTFPYIMFKPWCTDRHKLVLYYENINIPEDDYSNSEPEGLYTNTDTSNTIYYNHLRIKDISILNSSLSKSLEIVSKIIRELGIHTLRTAHENYFAYEIKENKLNLLHVVSNISVNREQFIDLLLNISALPDSYSMNDLFKNINLERYTGKIAEGKVLGIPLPFTFSDDLPLLFQPIGNISRIITTNGLENEFDLGMHFQKQNEDLHKMYFGNCWNYIDI